MDVVCCMCSLASFSAIFQLCYYLLGCKNLAAAVQLFELLCTENLHQAVCGWEW